MNGSPYLRVQAVFVLSSLGALLTAINWPGRHQGEGGLRDIDPLLARSQTQQSQRDERCCQSHSTPLDTERNGKVRITEREGHARAGPGRQPEWRAERQFVPPKDIPRESVPIVRYQGCEKYEWTVARGLTRSPARRAEQSNREVRGLCQRLITDPEYRRCLETRLRAGTLPHALEALIWNYAFGRPPQSLDVHNHGPSLASIIAGTATDDEDTDD